LTVLKHGACWASSITAEAGDAGDPKVIDTTGYVPQSYVVEAVEKGRVQLAGKAEINATRETRGLPEGVVTLPPPTSSARGPAKYEAMARATG